MGKGKFSEEMAKNLKTMLDKGLRKSEIAKRLGISGTTLSKWCNEQRMADYEAFNKDKKNYKAETINTENITFEVKKCRLYDYYMMFSKWDYENFVIDRTIQR